MKNPTRFLGFLFCQAALHGAASAADVGVSVNISQPGLYGRIDIGRVPAPVVVYPQPIIIEQHPAALGRQPIYLRVPPGHEKHWDKHCKRYNACNQPVYFVQEGWYRDVYAPRYYAAPEGRGEGRQDHKKKKKGHGDK